MIKYFLQINKVLSNVRLYSIHKMTNYVQKQMSYFFSSSETLGAKKYNNGSRFTISMQNLASIPKTAIDCTLEISSANIWHVSPNIDDINWKND